MGDQQEPAALGAQIGDARRARRMTQQQLADALGVDRKTVNRWEAGRTNGLGPNVARLGEVLGWSDDQVTAILRGGTPELVGGLPRDPDGSPYATTAAAVTARITRLLAADGPLPPWDRAYLAAALSAVVDLLDNPTAQAERLRQVAAEANAERTLAGLAERPRMEPTVAEPAQRD